VRKAALILTTAVLLAGIAMPRPAEAWRGGYGPGIAGGFIAGAVIGGLAASSAYAYAPGYAYGGPVYYGPGPGYYAYRRCPGRGEGGGDYYNCGAFAVPPYGYNYSPW
jgi:hypothetical protein